MEEIEKLREKINATNTNAIRNSIFLFFLVDLRVDVFLLYNAKNQQFRLLHLLRKFDFFFLVN